MLSAGVVIPGFFVIGLAFIGIGVGLLITSRSIQVLELDYTGTETNSPCYKCTTPPVQNNCVCKLNFTIDTLFKGPVFFYYSLTNYFQSQRKYGASKDYNQLSGDLTYFKSPASDCDPYQYANGKPIVPCGSLANSMFNDTFKLYQIINGQEKLVPFDGKGIAWWTDYNIKYRNPDYSPLKNAFNDTVKPVFWSKAAYELDTSDATNNGFVNQDFLVWMRRAALPNFRKLYRRITEGDYKDGLPVGNYSLEISYNYPVISFDGTKKATFSNVSWMGGQNEFLGIAYLVIGSMCVVMSIVMLIVYAKFRFPDDD
ncbi:hypothetical protein OJAV_G00216220 [Oryzias javanicus]|uniref:Cell cycle control protein n=1 Tax=Oryzias javanicus TaxID=123683 RepID=A0A437C440_ORYJA|nr:hypothetical protein OJAV_G00216220 [Oryzias javanicus]